MALKKLSTEQMFEFTRRWLGGQRSLLEAVPEVKALLPRLEEAFGSLKVAQDNAGVPEAVRNIQQEERQVDVRHDALVRGIYMSLTGRAELSDSLEETSGLIGLRDRVLPYGMGISLRSYAEEAGAAGMLERRLTDSEKAQLQAIPIDASRNMLDAVNELIAKGKRLGVLEEEKQLAIAQAAEEAGESAFDVQRARNQWIRVVHTLESLLEIAGVSEEIVKQLLGPLREAERAADRREEEEREREAKKA